MDLQYYKSLKFRVGLILRISRMNCFREITYHMNVLAVYCNNLKIHEIKFQRTDVHGENCKT